METKHRHSSARHLLQALALSLLLMLSMPPSAALADDSLPPPDPAPFGSVAGTVTDAATSLPIQGAEACATTTEPVFDPGVCVETNTSGFYAIPDLTTGSYKVEFFAPDGTNYARQFYSGVGDWEDATGVAVTEGQTTNNIDAQMKQGGRISGRVTSSATTLPIQGIEVCASVTGVVTGEGLYDACVTTNSNGEYLLSGLASLYFDLAFGLPDDKGPNYIREFYNDKPFFYMADAVEVAAPGTTTTGVDAALDPGGTISGTVTDEVTSLPVADVEVCAHENGAQGDTWGCTHTDANGNYTMVGLASKQYRVRFEPPVNSEYLSQVYDDADRFYAGDLVTMTAPNTITNIDAHLRKEGSITGTVTAEGTGNPIQGAWVCAFLEGFEDPEYTHCTQTDANGDYRVKRLSAGPYTMEFWASPQGYLAEYYDNKTFATADDISVAYGITTSGINAALTKNLKPINTAKPAITGTPAVGQTLSCSTGTWLNDPTDFDFQWKRDGNGISGETSNSYTVQEDDLGTALNCEVTATNAHGSTPVISEFFFIPDDDPAQHELHVWKEGTGSGTVSSDTAGISCGLTCEASLDEGTTLTLVATADPGSYFAGWTVSPAVANCEQEPNPCQLALNEDIEVTAFFYKASDKEEQPKDNPAQLPANNGTPPPPASTGGKKPGQKQAQARKRALKKCKKLKGKAKRRCVRKANASKRISRLALAADLSELCVKAGSAKPRMLDGGPWLNHPGDRKTQTFAAEAEWRRMPEECHGAYRRIPKIRFQIQNPRYHAQWINAGSYLSPTKDFRVIEEELEEVEQEREAEGESCWRPIPGGEKNICHIDPHVGNDGGVAEAYFSPPRRLHEPSYSRHDPRLYLCTPGKVVTHVRALFKTTVMNVKTGKAASDRVSVVPVRVRSYSRKPRNAWRGAVQGPC